VVAEDCLGVAGEKGAIDLGDDAVTVLVADEDARDLERRSDALGEVGGVSLQEAYDTAPHCPAPEEP
jgi:hypothetical protein